MVISPTQTLVTQSLPHLLHILIQNACGKAWSSHSTSLTSGTLGLRVSCDYVKARACFRSQNWLKRFSKHTISPNILDMSPTQQAKFSSSFKVLHYTKSNWVLVWTSRWRIRCMIGDGDLSGLGERQWQMRHERNAQVPSSRCFQFSLVMVVRQLIFQLEKEFQNALLVNGL